MVIERVDSEEFIKQFNLVNTEFLELEDEIVLNNQYDYENSGSFQSESQEEYSKQSSPFKPRSIMESNLADELMMLQQDGNMFEQLSC